MTKAKTTSTRARYTLEFKREAVLVEGGQSIAAAALARLVPRSLKLSKKQPGTPSSHDNQLDSRQTKDEVMAWLTWCNSTRMHSTLDDVSPMQFEQNWLAAQPEQANS